MKKIVLMLAILLIAAPAWATVYITCTDSGGGVVTISYDATEESEPVRAFALDITLDNDVNIVAVNDVNPKYWVYPGSIVIVGNAVNDVGSAVCDGVQYPETLPGIGFNGATVEMGSLYIGAPNAPGPNGVLCTITVNGSCCVDVDENVIRGGGAILEDGDVATIDVTGAHVCVTVGDGPCFPEAHPDYQAWLERSEPNSWCNPRQCHGDADGALQTRGKFDYWVSYPDLDLFIEGFGEPNTAYVDQDTDPWIAADFDHDKQTRGKFDYFVSYPDLDIFIAGFGDPCTIGPDPNCITYYVP